MLAIEAAAHLADDRLLPGLQALGEPESDIDPLHDALRNCDPIERGRWEAIGGSLFEADIPEEAASAAGDGEPI